MVEICRSGLDVSISVTAEGVGVMSSDTMLGSGVEEITEVGASGVSAVAVSRMMLVSVDTVVGTGTVCV